MDESGRLAADYVKPDQPVSVLPFMEHLNRLRL